MKVKRLPSNPGLSGWNEILPPRARGPALEADITSDWLVIGAGFAGLAAARRLRQLHRTDKITILEAVGIAEGPVGRNSGFMIDVPHNLTSGDYAGGQAKDQFQIQLNRAAISFAREMADEFEFDEGTLVQSGKINSAATSKGVRHNREFADHLKALGEPCELLDADEMSQITGSTYYQSGLYTPGSVMIQPAQFARGVASGLIRQGVSIYENSPVVELNPDGNAWVAKTPGGRVSAPNVIMAVNGHAESFGFFERRLMHVALFASMTRALDQGEVKTLGGEANWGCTPSDPMGSTVRRFSGPHGDRIVVRNGFAYCPSRDVSTAEFAAGTAKHKKSFTDRFPALKNVEMEHTWGGFLCLSTNSVPAFGSREKGLYFACCQNGLGAATGTISGKLAAEQASGDSSQLLTVMLAFAPPKKLPIEPLATLGAKTFMRWCEFRAGREL